MVKFGNHRGAPPELLYAVIRNETRFDPAALSSKGALGLFQFISATFKSLNNQWNLLENSDAPSRQAFLLDPEKNVDLGARWFGEELLPRQEGNILLAVMEHHAGNSAVRRWQDGWKRTNFFGDIEFMIETIGYRSTRHFVRRVIADYTVAESIGFLNQN